MQAQCDHGFVTASQYVVARTESTFFLQPAEQPIVNIAPFVLGPVKQSRYAGPRLAKHSAQRNHRLHAVAVTVLTQH